MIARLIASLAVMSVAFGTAAQEPVRVFAAGSLNASMTELARAFTAAGGPAVVTTFCASGLLRERIERNEGADVFASADVGQPQALAARGMASPPVVFARNRLCALLAPGVEVSAATLLDRMLDPAINSARRPPRPIRRATMPGSSSTRRKSCGRVRTPRWIGRRSSSSAAPIRRGPSPDARFTR